MAPPRSASSDQLPDLAQSGLIPLYKIPSRAKIASASLTFSKDEPLQFTRESFARVMVDPRLHGSFVEFVEHEHCGENIQFYEALAKLEDLIASSTLASSIQEAAAYESARSAGATHALARFLRASATATGSSHEEPTNASSVLVYLPPLPYIPAPPSLRSKYVEMYNTFIAQASPQEVNVTDATRRRIAAALAPALAGDAGDDAAPPATVFDAAGDEIVDLLYRDTFKRFVAWHAKMATAAAQAETGTSSPNSSTLSSSRPSADGRRRKTNDLDDADDFVDPMEDLTPDLAMMLLAHAAMQAEETRAAKQREAAAAAAAKKTPFWRRKKVEAGDPGKPAVKEDLAGAATGMEAVSTSRRSSTSSQASGNTGNNASQPPQRPPRVDEEPAAAGTNTGNFAKPANAGRQRKNSLFGVKAPPAIPPPMPTPQQLPAPPPMKATKSSPGPLFPSPQVDTSPRVVAAPRGPADLKPLDVSDKAVRSGGAEAPKSAGWSGFGRSRKNSGGGATGQEVFVAPPEEAGSLPELPPVRRKMVPR
ncbi:hypothetical protein HDU96_004922 [Phlyctochytrium bullatum]|nr:hypothetical protein HDU96_004922 [Phlyctochytrium bullatum]